jgi:hypothetical protein
MKKPFRAPIVFSLSFLLGLSTLLGCSFFPLPTESGAVLFQDDFSSPSSGWDHYQDNTYLSDYRNGAYRIAVQEPNRQAWALAGLELSDVHIDIDTRLSEGPEDNAFGVLCRYQDADNFYFFLISSDGFAGVGINQNGERSLLSGESLLPLADGVMTSEAAHLEVLCDRTTLSLSVNGTLFSSVSHTGWQTGDVGLIVGTYDQPGTTIDFDNFVVRNP